MTRPAFERQLTEIQDDMLALATMAEAAIERSMDALKDRDVELARQIIADDLKINEKRYNTEERCLALVATQQPLASDLRTIVAVLHIIVDLERIADHAEGNAKLALMLAEEPPFKPDIDPARHLPDLGGPQPGANRRPRDQHLRARGLHGHGPRPGVERLQVLARRRLRPVNAEAGGANALRRHFVRQAVATEANPTQQRTRAREG